MTATTAKERARGYRRSASPYGLDSATTATSLRQAPYSAIQLRHCCEDRLESGLAALVGVVDQPGCGTPARERHLQRVDDQLGRMWVAIDQPTIWRE